MVTSAISDELEQQLYKLVMFDSNELTAAGGTTIGDIVANAETWQQRVIARRATGILADPTAAAQMVQACMTASVDELDAVRAQPGAMAALGRATAGLHHWAWVAIFKAGWADASRHAGTFWVDTLASCRGVVDSTAGKDLPDVDVLGGMLEANPGDPALIIAALELLTLHANPQTMTGKQAQHLVGLLDETNRTAICALIRRRAPRKPTPEEAERRAQIHEPARSLLTGSALELYDARYLAPYEAAAAKAHAEHEAYLDYWGEYARPEPTN